MCQAARGKLKCSGDLSVLVAFLSIAGTKYLRAKIKEGKV